MKINIGKGINDILFGMKENELKEKMGIPDEIDVMEQDDGVVTRSLEYYDHGLTFSFDSDDGDKLSSIAINDKGIKFGGVEVGMARDAVLTAGAQNEWGDAEIEDLSDDDPFSMEVVMFDKISLSIWLENDEVTEIEFGPLWADEENIVWPS
ncbi:MAG: hypothetical protein MK226_10985 [Saprospiraceae bacterium]|jgi:hypothetical protein|nr:hypothetical protein [Saprospiraceae bacterium]